MIVQIYVDDIVFKSIALYNADAKFIAARS